MLAAGFGDTRFFIAEGNHFPKGSPYYSRGRHRPLQPAQRQEGQGRGRAGRLQGRADPRADQPAVRLPLQHGAADGRAAQARRLQGRPNVVDWATLVQRRNDAEAVGHLHHALRPVPRADALAAAARRRRARAGGARRPSRPRWPRSTARPTRPSAARCGARCSRWSTTRCRTSTSASSTACRRKQPGARQLPAGDLAVLLEREDQVGADRSTSDAAFHRLARRAACWRCWPSWRCWCSC